MLTVPYVTTAELVEHDPVFADLLNLSGGDPLLATRTADLHRLVLSASEWCDRKCFGADGTLTAHTHTETLRARTDRAGRLRLHPTHIPLTRVNSVGYGRLLGQLTTLTTPTAFIEDGRSAVVDTVGAGGAWSGRLHLGPPTVGDLFTTWVYVAGYPNTLLVGTPAAGATTINVADTTGITPGQVLRVADPGMEETVTVGPGWVPAAGPGTLPLTAGLVSGHSAPATGQIRVTALPRDITEAAVYYTQVLLMRPGVTPDSVGGTVPHAPGGAKETTDGDSGQQSTATSAIQGRLGRSALIAEAEALLKPHRRVY